jgi:GT2 family glycosyltransferase
MNLQTDGKFFQRGSDRLWLRTVTYGPFPPEKTPDPRKELARIEAANFNSIRVFSLPGKALLDAAEEHGLLVFAGLNWRQFEDFISQPSLLSSARIQLCEWLKRHSSHPALAAVYVGNEIPSDMVRWMGPATVRKSIESLIDSGRKIAPHLLFAYANYPSTEYLEPVNADFTAFNIYLENPDPFTSYLRRLQNIAGDRPLVVSEFGIDSHRHSPQTQAETLSWALKAADREETAGFTVFAWSDLWFNGGAEITDWNFGITDREGDPKPGLLACQNFTPSTRWNTDRSYSIVICTRNGATRITDCLNAVKALAERDIETIVVDDGSVDGTSEIVSEKFPEVCLITIPPSGLSEARNCGIDASSGDIVAFTDDDCEPDSEWLVRLDRAFENPDIAAAGGPNLPPPAKHSAQAIVNAAPGAPSHVLLDDSRAEHLPGCNIAVRREALEAIGGFDPSFHTAGDDVDLCWRLRDAGFELGFVPGAFVWHWRRLSLLAFLKQQTGYGLAERILLAKHPQRFSKTGETRWDGFVYAGGPVRVDSGSIIYHGPMGQAGYQNIASRMLPLRPVEPKYLTPATTLLHHCICWLQPVLRRWSRNHRIKLPALPMPKTQNPEETSEFHISTDSQVERCSILNHLISKGWVAAGPHDAWDLEKNGNRLLIATERLDQQHLRHLFRVWGEPEAVRKSLHPFINLY